MKPIGSLVAWILLTNILPSEAPAQEAASQGRAPVTVADAIAMTRLADPQYFRGEPSNGRVAQFSPDGSRFVIVLRKGNLERNVNEFSIYLFRKSGIFSSPQPERLLTMASSSNSDAIKDLQWLGDNETLAFIGEEPGKTSQVYTLNIHTRALDQRTSHLTSIVAFAITRDGQTVIYVAEPLAAKTTNGGHEVVINGEGLAELLEGDAYKARWNDQLFSQRVGKPEVPIAIGDPILVFSGHDLSLSPDGRYGLITVQERRPPSWWADYSSEDKGTNAYLHHFADVKLKRGDFSVYLTKLVLVDTHTSTSASFLDTPLTGREPIVWKSDSRSVYTRTYLPLNVSDTTERGLRRNTKFNVELALPSAEVRRRLMDKEWRRKTTKKPARESVAIILKESLNAPPKIYATDPKTKDEALLLDLNPNFARLQFGNVETVEWEVAPGLKVKGGLFLPPDYEKGKKAPLVIQTHGFWDDRFSMDGSPEWSSGYAARPLAAKGFVVLQLYSVNQTFPVEHYNDDKRFGTTRSQASRRFGASACEAAVEYLNSRGLIDPARVGISGFSRTVSDVGYILTHPEHHYAAAVLTNGWDAGYFQYISYANAQARWETNEVYAGAIPFGEGLKVWLKESPSFNLDKVTTPVRLVSFRPSSLLEFWEWNNGLWLQDKPAELIMLPDADHLLTKPYERQVAQQGIVDWFDFWLNGHEDPDLAKAEQYQRWEQLCDLQVAQNPNQPAFCVRTKTH